MGILTDPVTFETMWYNPKTGVKFKQHKTFGALDPKIERSVLYQACLDIENEKSRTQAH